MFQLTPVNHSIYNYSCYELNTYYTFAEFHFLLITFALTLSYGKDDGAHAHGVLRAAYHPEKCETVITLLIHS